MTMHNVDSKYFVYVYIDGVRTRYKLADGKLTPDLATKSSFSITIKGVAPDAGNPSFTNSLDALPAGDHKIKIEIWPELKVLGHHRLPLQAENLHSPKKQMPKTH